MSDSALDAPQLRLYREQAEDKPGWLDQTWRAISGAGSRLFPFAQKTRAIQFIKLVNKAEAQHAGLADAELFSLAQSLRRELTIQRNATSVQVRSFALIREVSKRQLDMRHYDVQVQAGFALLNGAIAEMDTGEGKTLAATLAAATSALGGVPVHVITVNDYLAQRDAHDLKRLYEFLGLSVGVVVQGMNPAERRAAYRCDITYASNKELTFDYLRDRLILGNHINTAGIKLKRLQGASDDRQVVMNGLDFAIVDEADSVLVDEARTPLIISKQSDPKDEEVIATNSLALVADLQKDRDFQIVEEERRIELTDAGKKNLADLGEQMGGIWRGVVRREEAARQALSALYLFHEGDHYLVRDNKIEIVDEYTGRIMAERSWSAGLHQILEVKEGCEVTGQNLPIARLTYQRLFRRYCKLAGLTGTAREIRDEVWAVYRLPVRKVPPNRPRRRIRLPTRVFATADLKWAAIVARTVEVSNQGRPILIGTRSVKTSEELSERLAQANVEHVVLNAAQDADESDIIALAGKPARVTVATNMAGRGVDIKLGEGVADKGGLHVILSERHDARRIDRQLEGRCGRQGDPGSTEALLSLEDRILELISVPLWAQPWVHGPGARFGSLLIYLAQRRAERAHARTRRALMKSDQKQAELLAFGGGVE